MGQLNETRLFRCIASVFARIVGVPFLLPLLLLLGATGALLGGCLLGIDRLAFRDVSHFYTPLYGYVATQERTQWLPLYNDLDHAGIPLAGETSTALFYPVRRILFRLIDSPETAIAWYIALHLMVAGMAAAWASVKAGASRSGASIAMIAYPLSGPIWFLYTNPPFLVGAAWLPFALGGGFSLLRSCQLKDLMVTSAAIALMILGGDPQTAIHVVLIGGAAWLAKTMGSLATAPRESSINLIKTSIGSLASLAAALLVATLLAAPQIAASIDWAPQSVRYAEHDIDTRHEIFAFSVAPWHWAELLAPSISGFLFPQYSRISHLIPGDGRTWAITLYCGLFPLALAVLRYKRLITSRFTLKRSRLHRLDGWDFIAPLGLIFAMGNLSMSSFIRWVYPDLLVGLDDTLLHPYGWLVAWLPGYDGFRYPAKWLVFVPLGISIAAARQASTWTPAASNAASRVAVTLAMVSFLLATFVVIALNVLLSLFPEFARRSDAIWGPINFGAVGWFLATSTLAVVCIAKLFNTVDRTIPHRRVAFACLLLLITVDLLIVARPSLATINRDSELRLIESAGKHATTPLTTNHSSGFPTRALRFATRGWPDDLRITASPGEQRILVAEASMRNSLFGRWHLADRTAVFNSATSLPPGRLRAFWKAANQKSREIAPEAQSRYRTRIMRWLAINQAWTVEDSRGGLPRDNAGIALTSIIRKPIADVSPPVTWHRQWRQIDAGDRLSPTSLAQRIDEIVSNDQAIDIPWIETPTRVHAQSSVQNLTSDKGSGQNVDEMQPPESFIATYTKAGHWSILVNAASEGLLCIKQFQDGNFRASVRRVDQSGTPNAHSYEVYQCDFFFSAVKLPAGHHEVRIEYLPRWKGPSILLATATWMILLSITLWRRLQTHKLFGTAPSH